MAKRRDTRRRSTNSDPPASPLAGAFSRGARTEVDFLLPPKAPTEPPPAPIRFALDPPAEAGSPAPVPAIEPLGDDDEPFGLDELTGFEPTGFDDAVAPSGAPGEPVVARFTTDTVVVEATAPDRPLTSSVTLSRAAIARAIEGPEREQQAATRDDTPVVQVRLRPTIEPPLLQRAAPGAKASDVWATPPAPRASIELDLDETQVAPRIPVEPDADALRDAWVPAFPPIAARGRVRRFVSRVVRLVFRITAR